MKRYLKLKLKELKDSIKRVFCQHNDTSGILNHRSTFWITVEEITDMSICMNCGKIEFDIRYFSLKKGDEELPAIKTKSF